MSASALLVYALTALLLAAVPVAAVRVPFTNCLDESHVAANRLQWKPLYADAKFDTTNPQHQLDVVVWGNVTGYQDPSNPPPTLAQDPNRLYWKNDSQSNGKIIQSANPDSADSKATTLIRRVDMLSYRPLNDRVYFCKEALNGGTCPLGPYFNTSSLYVVFVNCFAKTEC